MMKGIIKGIAAAALAISLLACSTSQANNPLEQFLRNVSAAECSTPQAQQQALAQIPLGFVSQAQAQAMLETVCNGLFGSVAAPSTAPGNVPAIPGSLAMPHKS